MKDYVSMHRDFRNCDKGTGKKITSESKYLIYPMGGAPMPTPTRFQHDLPGAGKPKGKKVTD